MPRYVSPCRRATSTGSGCLLANHVTLHKTDVLIYERRGSFYSFEVACQERIAAVRGRGRAVRRRVTRAPAAACHVNPASFALVGASPEPGKVGHSALQSLQRYAGQLYPVNAMGHVEIHGIKPFRSLNDMPGTINLVVVMVDLMFVPDVLRW